MEPSRHRWSNDEGVHAGPDGSGWFDEAWPGAALTNRIRALVTILSVSATGATGCAGESTSSEISMQTLREQFPEHAGRVLGGVEPFVASADGSVFRPAGDALASQRRDGLELELPSQAGGVIQWTTRDGLDIRLREMESSGRGRPAENVVVYEGRGRSSFWSATPFGYEEWVLLEPEQVRRDAAVAVWVVEGATPRLKHGWVELCDAAQVPRIRARAAESFAASGRAVEVSLRVVGNRIEAWVDAENETVLLDPEWSSTGLMVDARWGHTATLLLNGKVLLAGGSGEPLKTAELYDPKTHVWSPTGALSEGRYGHTATLLPNGKVLVAGGDADSAFVDEDDEPLASAELYDPTTEAWMPTGSMTSPHSLHTATLLPDGDVLVAGGYCDCDGPTAELYNPTTGQWAATGPMASERFEHTATLLPDSRVLVAGGQGPSAEGTAEIYDPATGAWTSTGDLTTARRRHTATLLTTGKVLIAGGREALLSVLASAASEVFDPVTGAWTASGDMSSRRWDAPLTTLPSGRVLIAGGRDPEITPSVLDLAELYDPVAGSWLPAASMASKHAGHSATSLQDGRVLIAGGSNGEMLVPLSEVYDPGLTPWKKEASMTSGRALHTATRLKAPDGRVLVAAGHDGSAHLNTAELYDPATGSWTATTGSLLSPRIQHTMTLLPDGAVLVTGGWDGSTTFETAERYEPQTDSWATTAVPMASARRLHAATLLQNGVVLVSGGLESSEPSLLDTTELYDPVNDSWAASANPMAWSHDAHTATLLKSGLVLLAGGGGGDEGWNTPELHDPISGAWVEIDFMENRPVGHTATLLADGRVLVAGGKELAALSVAVLYDPTSKTWTPTTKMSVQRTQHTATLLDPDTNGKQRVLVTGGTLGDTLASAEVYDVERELWLPASPMFEARRAHTATKLVDGSVLIAGGRNESGYLGSAERFVQTEDGGLCMFAGDCRSGFCVDGVCCKTPCDSGECDACSVAAGADQSGTCMLLVGTVCSETGTCKSLCHDGVCGDDDQQPDGTPCDDGNGCTENDTCQAGDCVSGPVCPPHDSCSEPGICSGDGCIAGGPILCSPADQCHEAGVCEPETGACSEPPMPDGTACDDGVACTESDVCVDGACQGTAVICDDFLACSSVDGSCPAACKAVHDCVPGKICDPDGQCVDPLTTTTSCHRCSQSPSGPPGDVPVGGSSLLLMGLALRRLRRRSFAGSG